MVTGLERSTEFGEPGIGRAGREAPAFEGDLCSSVPEVSEGLSGGGNWLRLLRDSCFQRVLVSESCST